MKSPRDTERVRRIKGRPNARQKLFFASRARYTAY